MLSITISTLTINSNHNTTCMQPCMAYRSSTDASPSCNNNEAVCVFGNLLSLTWNYLKMNKFKINFSEHGLIQKAF